MSWFSLNNVQYHNTRITSMSHDTHHNKTPCDQFSDDDITIFDTFINDHISFFVALHQRKHLDMDNTKEHVLNMLLNTKFVNDEFWKQ